MGRSRIIQEYPYRSPLVVADVLRPLMIGKTVCDVGCGAGDLLELWEPYADGTYGMDNDSDLTELGVKEGRRILTQDFRKAPVPPADVYYMWLLPWVLDDIVLPKVSSGLIILGDYDDKPELTTDYGGSTIRVPYEENGEKGWFRLTIFKK